MEQSLLNRTHPLDSRRESDEETLSEVLRERDRFLEEHPELRWLQDEIDRSLEDVESPEERMLILQEMLRVKLEELFREMSNLRDLLVGIRFGALDSSN